MELKNTLATIAKSFPRISNFLDLADTKLETIEKGSEKRYSYKLKHQKTYQFEAGQEDLRLAIQSAEDPNFPSRYLLYGIYREALRDLHLKSQIRSSIYKVTSSPWAIIHKKTKEINVEATELLQRQWFDDISRLQLEAEFWGHSLIELGQLSDINGNGLEFESTKLFPREHICPEKGLILLDPHQLTGLPFREAPINEWFLEAGDPHDLGLLQDCAKYSIFKKYALSDWSRSTEKWGDPLLAIKSASDDDTENDKKAEFAANFGNNGYVMLGEDDDIQLMERKNGSGYQIFKDNAEFMNQENSKGVNGQVGTSDEKSFVGAAEVQERLLGEYTEARMRRLQYFHNQKTIPYLQKVLGGNTAYSVLKDHVFIWQDFMTDKSNKEDDNQNTPPDPKTEEQQKETERGGTKNSLGKSQADKPSALATKINNLYKPCCTVPQVLTLNNSIADNAVKRAVERVYQRKLKRGDVDAELFKQHSSEIWEGAKQGFSDKIKDVKYGSNAHLLRHQLKYNASVFAAFKVQHNVLDMHKQLFDTNGKLKTRNQFVKDVSSINKTYNKNWLKTEYNLAKSQARMGAYYVKHKDKGGFFVFKTINDGNTRKEHSLLHNVKLPVDDPFWDTYWPPLAWGCRCYIIWVKSGDTKEPDGLPEVKGMFAHNAGKNGKIFNEEHPFFEIDAGFAQTMVRFLTKNAPEKPDLFSAKIALYEHYKNDLDYVTKGTFKDSGGFVVAHKKADPSDLVENVKAGKLIANYDGSTVVIRKHINSDGVKNPEFLINEVLSDLKTPNINSKNGISNAFKSARKQGINEFVLKVLDGSSIDGLITGISEGFRRSSSINKVLILHNEKLLWVTRKDWADGGIHQLITEGL